MDCWGDVWAPQQAYCFDHAGWAVVGSDVLDDGQVVTVVAGACDRHMLSTRQRFSVAGPATVVDAGWYVMNRDRIRREAGGEVFEARRVA